MDVSKYDYYFVTMPTYCVSVERPFSVIKPVKNHLRNSLGQDHLSNLSIIKNST